MNGHAKALTAAARRVARLQDKERRAKRELAAVKAELKMARKQLRALAESSMGEIVPFRSTGDGEQLPPQWKKLAAASSK